MIPLELLKNQVLFFEFGHFSVKENSQKYSEGFPCENLWIFLIKKCKNKKVIVFVWISREANKYCAREDMAKWLDVWYGRKTWKGVPRDAVRTLLRENYFWISSFSQKYANEKEKSQTNIIKSSKENFLTTYSIEVNLVNVRLFFPKNKSSHTHLLPHSHARSSSSSFAKLLY